jgi:hypothetical protein
LETVIGIEPMIKSLCILTGVTRSENLPPGQTGGKDAMREKTAKWQLGNNQLIG